MHSSETLLSDSLPSRPCIYFGPCPGIWIPCSVRQCTLTMSCSATLKGDVVCRYVACKNDTTTAKTHTCLHGILTNDTYPTSRMPGVLALPLTRTVKARLASHVPELSSFFFFFFFLPLSVCRLNQMFVCVLPFC